jgi:hypothetical protein
VKWKTAWAASVWEVFDELSEAERNEILVHLKYIKRFPHMYPVRARFRRHRWFLAGNWLVYYRVVQNTGYIRGLWPAQFLDLPFALDPNHSAGTDVHKIAIT